MVASFSQLLARRYGEHLDDKGRIMMGHLTDGARRMQTLVNSLLTYARVGGRPGTDDRTDMSAAAHGALALLAESVRASGAVIEIDPAMPCAPLADVEALQLWQNLLSNAIKHHGAGAPRVHVGVRTGPAGEPVYFVFDDGPGIAARHQERVFQIFQRLEIAPQRRHDGAGIGLALCRRIVEGVKGRIWIESDGSTGSTICFTLPTLRGETR